MTVRNILRWPDPRLRVVCEPVVSISTGIKDLVADMFETMYAAPGRGLAAPQVGVLSRVFVMDTDWKDQASTPLVFINPEIVETGKGSATREEGCLSIPGLSVPVERPDTVRLRWLDLGGAAQEVRFVGFAAACVQHELDHLNGIVTLDRVTSAVRSQLLVDYEESIV